ncbi:MAG: hypothetical protein EOM24_21435 [Chloroflexia bacterium]|nr:hypothetical protein [Chloroflexia bacterium]
MYPGIPQWQERIKAFAIRNGYVLTAYGTRIHAQKELWSSEKRDVARQVRQLTNAVVQSTAACILKELRQTVWRTQMRERYGMRSIFQVYDEVTAFVRRDTAAEYIQEMVGHMRLTPPNYPVSMDVEASIGRSWGAQKEVDLSSMDSIRAAVEAV